MRPLAQKALEAIQKRGGKVVSTDLIETTLREIGKGYRPGLIGWIKGNPDRWNRLLQTEEGINEGALLRDEAALKNALSEYRGFFNVMVSAYGKGETLPLFGGRVNE